MLLFFNPSHLKQKSQDFRSLRIMGYITYKRWTGDVGQRITETMRTAYPDGDTFFVSSGAYDAGVSERTLRSYLRTDPTLHFVDRLPGGGIATCSQSMSAWGISHRKNDGRKDVNTWENNFVRDVQVTEVNSGSS